MERIPRQISEWSHFRSFNDDDSNEVIVKKLLDHMNHSHLKYCIPNIIKAFDEMVKECNGYHNNHKALIGTALGYLHKRHLLQIDINP